MIGTILIGIGTGLVLIGTIGILRFSDIYSRLQASGVSDNAGVGLILIGLMVRNGPTSISLGLGLLLALILVTNPIVTHAIAKSAFVNRHSGEGKE